MTASLVSNIFAGSSLPATAALKEEQQKLMVAREGQRAGRIDTKLAHKLFTLNFDDDDEMDSFPTIEWSSDSDSESSDSSVRSLNSLNSFLTKSDSRRKRDRDDGSSRRLVRSKKIKSNLSLLAFGPSA